MKSDTPVRKLAQAWLPAVLWMAVLFTVSTEVGSSRRTSRLLVPLLRWLAPNLPQSTLDQVQLGVRKAGHAVGYAILAGLVWAGRRAGASAGPTTWRWADARFAFAVAVLYAGTDEWHQTFTATRQGTVADVLLDAVGAALGLGLLWLWSRWRRTGQPDRAGNLQESAG